MTTGKFDPETLQVSVLPYRGNLDPRVKLGGAIGGDGAVVEMSSGYLMLAADPITGTSTSVGKFLVDINVNDVAALGGRPRWLLLTLLVPPDTGGEEVERIMSSADKEAKRLGVSIVGGHTERVRNLTSPLLSGFMVGESPNFLDPKEVSIGDEVYLVGTAGMEGTAIVAEQFRDDLLQLGVSTETLDSAGKFLDQLSVMDSAMKLREGALLMHDPTEGGVLGGIAELSSLIDPVIEVFEGEIPVAEETRAICDPLDLDPLRLIGSGALLAVMPEGLQEEVKNRLPDRQVSLVGRVTDGEQKLEVTQDELWRLLEGRGK